MTTKNKNKRQIANSDELITALYCGLSVEDMKNHDKKLRQDGKVYFQDLFFVLIVVRNFIFALLKV